MGRLRLKSRGQRGNSPFDWGGTERYALEFIRPHATMNATDRWVAAYPGLEYNVRPGVIGGVYPYRYTLNNAPASMTIDADTGEISWPSPDVDANNISITVTDSKGSTATSTTWSIDVATTRFKFFSPTGNDTTGDGSVATPWQTLAKHKASSGVSGIGVFRTGTYDMTGLVSQSDGFRWGTTTSAPSIFLAYPGESPVFDFQDDQFDFVESGASPRVYFDGIDLTNAGNKCLRFASQNDNFVVRRCAIHDFGPGADSSNSSALNFESGGFGSGTLDYGLVQDCEFYNYIDDVINCCFKLYVTNKLLIENCDFHDLNIGGEDEEAIANKAGNARTTVRGCTATDMLQGFYGGNQNPNAATGYCGAEVCFNNVSATGEDVMLFNHDWNGTEVDPTYVYRNTIRGPLGFVKINTAAQGPWTFSNNVVVNEDGATDNPNGSGITHDITPVTTTPLVVENHLFGAAADGLVDANGLLTGASRTSYLYLRGHEVP
jgi:hypothetical protein